MKPSVLCAFIAAAALPVFAAESELKTATLPAGNYNILRDNTLNRPGNEQMPQFIGAVSKQENSSVVLKAASVEVGEDGVAKLRGNAQVQLIVAGKPMATFGSDEVDKRDQAALAALFSANARISLEELTPDGAVGSKEMNAAEFAEHFCKLFPTAWRVDVVLQIAGSTPDKDGSKTAATRLFDYVFSLPQGSLSYPIDQRMQLVRSGDQLLIESMSFGVPERTKQNFAVGGPGGIPLPRSPVSPRPR